MRAGRSLRSDADIVPSKEATFFIAADAANAPAIRAHADDLATLLRAAPGELRVVPAGGRGGGVGCYLYGRGSF